MLEPAFSRLDEEDAHFFREAARAGRFADETREFVRSFTVDWTWASLFEVGRETEGDTAEADGQWGPEVSKLREQSCSSLDLFIKIGAIAHRIKFPGE